MRYPTEHKEAIFKKVATPMSMTITELAEQEGITATTLCNWRKQASEVNPGIRTRREALIRPTRRT